MRRRSKRRRRRTNPMHHGLVCPSCGASVWRHGSGGRRRCLAGDVERCPGLECTCRRKHFLHRDGKLYWRRSPCPSAVCHHCGWKGALRSIYFERKFGLSRCTGTQNGCHDISVTATQNEHPGDLVFRCYCRKCSCIGLGSLDPTEEISWVDFLEEDTNDDTDA